MLPVIFQAFKLLASVEKVSAHGSKAWTIREVVLSVCSHKECVQVPIFAPTSNIQILSLCFRFSRTVDCTMVSPLVAGLLFTSRRDSLLRKRASLTRFFRPNAYQSTFSKRDLAIVLSKLLIPGLSTLCWFLFEYYFIMVFVFLMRLWPLQYQSSTYSGNKWGMQLQLQLN